MMCRHSNQVCGQPCRSTTGSPWPAVTTCRVTPLTSRDACWTSAGSTGSGGEDFSAPQAASNEATRLRVIKHCFMTSSLGAGSVQPVMEAFMRPKWTSHNVMRPDYHHHCYECRLRGSQPPGDSARGPV